MQKKTLVLSGILVVFIFFVFVPPALAIQRFVNKNFESSRIGYYGWGFWGGGTGRSDYSAVLDTTVKRTGRSVKVQVGAGAGPYGYVAGLFQVINSPDYAGKSVKLSVYCKTANGGKISLKINYTHANGVHETNWTPSVTSPVECLGAPWTKIETPWVTIPADAVSIEADSISSKKNGTVWLDDFDLETNPSLPVVIPDQRFGLGGSPQIAKDLNIPWFYNWGVDTTTSGIKKFFEIAHMGYSSIAENVLNDLKTQGLKDAEDQALYDRLNALLIKFEGKNLTNARGNLDYGGSCSDNPPPPSPTPALRPCKIDNLRKNFLNIGISLAHDYPGAYYQIGNEPDWYPYFKPEDYAELYNIFYTRIKKYDPSARVATGGLTSMSPIIPAYDPNDLFGWIDNFRNKYKEKFGSYPPIDIWDIHTYHPYPNLIDGDWNSTKKLIVDFRDIYLARIGEQNKPVWITEFGLLIYEGGVIHPGNACTTPGCLSPADQLLEWNMIANDYMKPLINWMKSNNYVQKWFWFYAGYNWNPNIRLQLGEIYMIPSGEYNPMGIMYKQLAEEGAEKIPNCSIDSGPAIINLGETATYNASFSSQQGNLGAHLSIGQNGITIGNYLSETFSSRTATAATGTFSWTPTTVGTFDLFCRAWNDGIAECRGNPAYIDNLPRYECAGPKAYMTVKVVSTPASTPTPLPASSHPGDLNSDAFVNNVDKTILVANFNKTGTVGGWIPADIDKNKIVDIFDYNILVANFGN